MQELTMLLDAGSSTPLYEQIYQFIVSEIHEGRLVEGARLPSKRAMCAHLGVSLSTVETAYGLLLAEGYVSSRPKSGFFVAASELPKALYRSRPLPSPPIVTPPPRLDTSTSAVDTSAFPYVTWARIFKQVLYERPDLLNRGDPQGDTELRDALSAFLYQYRGVRCRAEQLVVGAGMEHLLEILLRLTDANAPFALEDPGYGVPYRILEQHSRAIRPIPVDAEGMDVAALNRSDAQIAYVTPSHQFPTGVFMPMNRRMRLLSWAAAQPDRLIIEDDYDSEFRYSSRPVPALQGLADGERVIYIGTFSRTIAPSIRVAYMALPESLLRLYHRYDGRVVSPVSRFEQQTLARFLQGGYYARHLRRMGNIYRARCVSLSSALNALPDMRVTGADAGLHFLISHDSLTENEMLERAGALGLSLHGLSEYCRLTRPTPSTVVVGFAGLSDEQVNELVALLKQAWRK